ncbi:multicopper oxidase domain-containing protein [Oscillochloris sp. ZM17-4]|uniref:multicopper oxidase family protein n=1 Tax=Oscillochloris sp. ZM17-4 TaxID=2866714 RepID=UPI001C72D988|nr:multicopper oxidase domain-containing protein [Oscillochloris sp. ZM17-4]MBX0328376.1 multicopper oxidase domain-containing protein [Oscillochloris sp. ZM17-4]
MLRRTMSRRDLLRLAGSGALALGGAGALGACALPATLEPAQPAASPAFTPDLDLTMRAASTEVQILPGPKTTVWSYQATVHAGDPAAAQAIPGSYLGPIIRARSGQKVRITFENALPEPDQESIIHWHGLHLPAAVDGHPSDAVKPGERYVYEFTVANRAGTYWFHPHPHGKTGRQVMMGMAGLFLVSDAEEQAAGLPSGAQDIPLVIQDRAFDAQNQIVYGLDMMSQMMGFLGERVLVNGTPDVTLDLATRAYRLRLLNGSNSRIYKLAWDDATPLTVIASDGGLLEAPVSRPFVMLAPGERVELWADFRDRPLGAELRLVSQPFAGAEGVGAPGEAGGMGGMGGMQHGNMGGMGGTAGTASAPALGAALDILRVRIARQEAEPLTLPARLATIPRHRREDAVNKDNPRPVALTMNGMQWQLNGRSYEMNAVAPEEIVRLDTLEVWEIINEQNPGAMMDAMGMAHPIHIHGGQFQVIGRAVLPELQAGWAGVKDGYLDEGWKDTVLVMPGERVRLLMAFRDHAGAFVYHCHNLEHEDAGMMRNYRVEA